MLTEYPTKCVKCGEKYLVRMEASTNPVTGKKGFIQCQVLGCKHIHPWPEKK